LQNEVLNLSKKVNNLENDKDNMVDSFKLSSGVLLERIKDLEAQGNLGYERPQTA